MEKYSLFFLNEWSLDMSVFCHSNDNQIWDWAVKSGETKTRTEKSHRSYQCWYIKGVFVLCGVRVCVRIWSLIYMCKNIDCRFSLFFSVSYRIWPQTHAIRSFCTHLSSLYLNTSSQYNSPRSIEFICCCALRMDVYKKYDTRHVILLLL